MAELKDNVCDIVKAYTLVEKIIQDAGYWGKCKYDIQLLEVLDYTRKFKLVAPEYRELFFNKLKDKGVELDYKYYEGKKYYPIDYYAIDKFKNFNDMNYDEFCKHFYGGTK